MDKALLSTGKDDWGTPQKLYDALNKEFGFTLDACADKNNYKCANYYTAEADGYKESAEHGATVVMLIPARTDTKAFHEYILGKAQEIRFIKGRLKFEIDRKANKEAAPFPSMIVIFRGSSITKTNIEAYIQEKE